MNTGGKEGRGRERGTLLHERNGRKGTPTTAHARPPPPPYHRSRRRRRCPKLKGEKGRRSFRCAQEAIFIKPELGWKEGPNFFKEATVRTSHGSGRQRRVRVSAEEDHDGPGQEPATAAAPTPWRRAERLRLPQEELCAQERESLAQVRKKLELLWREQKETINFVCWPLPLASTALVPI